MPAVLLLIAARRWIDWIRDRAAGKQIAGVNFHGRKSCPLRSHHTGGRSLLRQPTPPRFHLEELVVQLANQLRASTALHPSARFPFTSIADQSDWVMSRSQLWRL